jgi:hypothetical protein
MNGGNIETMNEPLNTTELQPIVGKNGVLIDPVTKRFMKGGKPTTAIASSSQGRELANRRYEQAQEAVRAAVLREVAGISDIPINTPEDAFSFVVAKQTTALIDSDKPRFDDVERLGQLMGTVERSRDRQQTQDTATDAVTVALLALVDMMGDKHRQDDRQVIDGDVSDG